MTTLAQPIAIRQPDFVAALLADASPYAVGIVDAQKGEEMRPDLYFGDGDRAEYVQGYRDETDAIEQFGRDGELRELDATLQAMFVSPPKVDPRAVDYDAELDDLREGILDDEHHARGLW